MTPAARCRENSDPIRCGLRANSENSDPMPDTSSDAAYAARLASMESDELFASRLQQEDYLQGTPVSAAYADDAGRAIPTAEPAVPIHSGRRYYRVQRPDVLVYVPSQPHPLGVPPGGMWVEAAYFGPNSALCCCAWAIIFLPIALFIPLMPCDSEILYHAPDGTLWKPNGRYIGDWPIII